MNILLLEDDPDDAYLIQRALLSDLVDAQVLHVKNRTEFLEARQRCAGIPFICVSGSADEKHIRTCLDAGATEYISKDQLWKLSAAVRRAIES